VLEARFPETVETQPELLAHHYTEAGLLVQAIPYWQRAGQQAIQRSANVEAISHLTKGLEVLKTLPDTPDRAQQELTLQIALGAPLMTTKSYGAPDVERAYARARELCQQVGETPQLFPVLRGLWNFYLMRAELQTAQELGEQLLRLAQSAQDPALLLEAHQALGIALFWLGELTSALAHLEQGITLYDSRQHRSLAFLYGRDPGVTCLSYAAFALWRLGYPDQALKRNHEALTLAWELSHPFSISFSLHFAAALHQFRRERQLTQERAEAVIALSKEQGFAQRLAGGTILRGWVLTEQGQIEEGIAQIHQGMAAWQAIGGKIGRTHWFALLAETYRKAGWAEEGLSVLAKGLAAVHKSGERPWEAELYRLKGELVLTLSGENHAEAEACFRQALDVARRQRAKSLELRAVISLCRLWWQQGKKEEARQLLAEVYSWFTEGFETADLREAKALLEVV
jgi:predicted ATPase